MENQGVKNILILLTLFSVVILSALYLVYSEDYETTPKGESSISHLFAYLKYYAAKLIGFIFRV
ncbi:MAG: hypothetical protein PHE89_04585 [Alphaproteobacteria bacterium]|nr:hypothetical protein [Alphaproteobacteria bacterium]